jgi:hypothetical protein
MNSGCLQKIKSALKGQIFQDTEDIKKCDSNNENYSTTGVPKMFPTVAASLGQVYSCLKKYKSDPSPSC